MKRTALIAVVGRPNAGKSTLLNALLGEKVAIVSSKPQTTRNRIAGILTEGEDQFVFLDTPGLFKPRNPLGRYMVETANAAMEGVDAILLVADVGREISAAERDVTARAARAGTPVVLILNKIDLHRGEEVGDAILRYAALHEFAAVIPLSALKRDRVGEVIEECVPFLRESEWLFPEDTATDQPERRMAAEIIREKVLRTTNQEIPHGVAVVIRKFTEDERTGMVSIHAEIYCEKASHKGIILGKGGASLRRIGTYAREDLERLLGAKVYLDLWVRVRENWRDSERDVSEFGYRQDG